MKIINLEVLPQSHKNQAVWQEVDQDQVQSHSVLQSK